MTMTEEVRESVKRMGRDIRAAAEVLSIKEARYLVDSYYAMQEDRIRADHRVRQLNESGEPNAVVGWLSGQSELLESQIKGALDRYSAHHPVGRWARSIKGIGPVLAAGYIANIESVSRFATVGKLWRYAGIDPTADKRKRGEKLHFNPSLKRLVWLTGESFKRLSSDDADAVYRHVYDKRKAYEAAKNEAGDYREQAEKALTVKKYGADTKARSFYEAGKLPPGHLDRRAARYAAKMFVSHLHYVWWQIEQADTPYPLLYSHAHLGHVDWIAPPNWN